jgi:hypothetical protein
VPTATLPAQGPTARVAGQAVLVATRVDPIPAGGSLAELRLVQPILTLDLRAWRGRLLFQGTANVEGLTMPNGELAPGNWGEGFVDRRHPHTYLHELMLSLPDVLGPLHAPVRLTLSAGKGFVPFGTDDPMTRPPVRYPVNHHLSQILERAAIIAAVDAGPATLETALFNGDEPEHPGQAPRLGRLGDSWSVRLTLRPFAGFEWQASAALVHSPEHRPGAGTDQHKWSTAVRLERGLADTRLYALAEWARTSEAGGVFIFNSVLAETAVTVGQNRPYVRVERTERPEEMRTLDLFRSARPHLDNSILGITRWTVYTGGYALLVAAPARSFELRPFAEASFGRIATTIGVFAPAALYGRDTFWSASLGVRVGWGMAGHRMGRYGVDTKTAHMEKMP